MSDIAGELKQNFYKKLYINLRYVQENVQENTSKIKIYNEISGIREATGSKQHRRVRFCVSVVEVYLMVGRGAVLFAREDVNNFFHLLECLYVI